MTDTTIPDAATIAGLRAEVDALEIALRTTSEGFSDAEADRLRLTANLARLTAERDHLAGMPASDRDAAAAEVAIKAASVLRDNLDAVALAIGVGCSLSAADMTEDVVDAVAALKTERDRLKARVAELEARPVLTVERLAEQLAVHLSFDDGRHAKAPAKRILEALGPVTLPTPDRATAETLVRAYHSGNEAPVLAAARMTRDELVRAVDAMLRALASLAPQPAERATVEVAREAALRELKVAELEGQIERQGTEIAILRAARPAPEVERGWHPVGDGAFAPPFGTIRVCRGCGCLVAGGPTACVPCAKGGA